MSGGAGMSMGYYVYIMGNRRPTLYIGITNDLVRRVYEHKQGFVEGFTKKYGLHNLLYFEQFDSIEDAIIREKQLKHWNREWKLELIKQTNPTLKDLYVEIVN
jgi:putative endonuclease